MAGLGIIFIGNEAAHALEEGINIERRAELYFAHQWLCVMVVNDVWFAFRHVDGLARFSHHFLTIEQHMHFAAFYMEYFILVIVYMLVRNLATGLGYPFHYKCFFGVRDAAEGFSGVGVGKALV